jgi:uncharacterized membrane protein
LSDASLKLERSYYSGPLPSPEDLARYQQVHPDAVTIILGNFNEQGLHRRELEAHLVRGVEKRAGRGQYIGAFLVGLGIVGGCVVAVVGEGVAGAAIAGSAFTSAAVVFVVGGRPVNAED